MGQALRTEFARAWRAHLGERRLLSKEAHTHTNKQAHKIYTLSGRRRIATQMQLKKILNKHNDSRNPRVFSHTHMDLDADLHM